MSDEKQPLLSFEINSGKGLINDFGSPPNKKSVMKFVDKQKENFYEYQAKKAAAAADKELEDAGMFIYTGEKEDGSKGERLRQKVGIEGLVGDREKLAEKVNQAHIATTVTAVASGIITTLAATGIGMPVAALLAGALLIANKMFDIVKSNLLLRLLMQDAIFIIMDCYLLFSLIEKSYDIIVLYDDPFNDCTNTNIKSKMTVKPISQDEITQLISKVNKTIQPSSSTSSSSSSSTSSSSSSSTSSSSNNSGEDAMRVRKYQINKIMQAQLRYQIEKLINVLLHLMETKTLDMISQDPSLKDNAFGKLLKIESEKRQKEKGIKGYFSLSKIERNYDRKFGGSYYITEINNILTIINSYIVLLKSNLDTLLKKFEILTPEIYRIIWLAILCTVEYNSYIKPNTADVLELAKKDANEVGVNALVKSMALVENVEAGEAEAEASAGGSGRSYLRPRIKRKTERRQKKRKQRTKGRGRRRRQNKKSKRRTK
jgi:hypothetical protein